MGHRKGVGAEPWDIGGMGVGKEGQTWSEGSQADSSGDGDGFSIVQRSCG